MILMDTIPITLAAIGYACPIKISDHQITSFSSVSLHFESIWMHINMFVSQNHQDPTISLDAGLCTCPLRICSVGGFLLTTVKRQGIPYIPAFLYTGPKIQISDFPVDGLGIKALQDFQNLVFFKNQ